MTDTERPPFIVTVTNAYSAWQMIPEYVLAYRFSKDIPPFILRKGDKPIILSNRSFERVDAILGYLPSQEIGDRIAQGQAPVSVLDIGGGYEGQAARGVASLYGEDVSVTNLDVFLPINTDHFKPVKAVLADATKVPIISGSQDVIYSSYALTYLSRLELSVALPEITRVLKPGGVAILIEDVYREYSENSDELKALSERLGVTIGVPVVPKAGKRHPEHKMLVLRKPITS